MVNWVDIDNAEDNAPGTATDNILTIPGTGGNTPITITTSGNDGPFWVAPFSGATTNAQLLGSDNAGGNNNTFETIQMDFDQTVAGIQVKMIAFNDNEEFTVSVNGVDYLISDSEVSGAGAPNISVTGGNLVGDTSAGLDEIVLTLQPPGGIDSFSIGNLVLGGSGTFTDFFIDTDPFVAIPCFTTGMLIETATGPVAVDSLTPGTLLKTYDNGLKPVMHVMSSTVRARGLLAPVRFDTGAIGNAEPFIVSQKHRMFIGTLPQEIQKRFGDHKNYLIQAIELCNGKDIYVDTSAEQVTYFHIMLKDHELLFCDGTVSESFQPTKRALKLCPDQAEELLTIFPELKKRKACDPGALVRHEITTDASRIEKLATAGSGL